MNKCLRAASGVYRFLMARKRWWLVPIVALIALAALLVLLGQAPALGPFLYSLF